MKIVNNNELTAPVPIIYNKPIAGSKFIKEENGVKIYKYPEIKFNDEEEVRAISLMVVGQTGSGKTTLLNGFVNYLLGVQLEDDFRYKIIIEENDGDQSKSVTQKVTVYRISTNGRYPPIKIIDSPGYGDTGGIQRDIQITELV
jgi:septin family protein